MFSALYAQLLRHPIQRDITVGADHGRWSAPRTLDTGPPARGPSLDEVAAVVEGANARFDRLFPGKSGKRYVCRLLAPRSFYAAAHPRPRTARHRLAELGRRAERIQARDWQIERAAAAAKKPFRLTPPWER